jgi:maleate isomerase
MAISAKDPVKRVGIILPPPNPTVEPEYHAALPRGVVMHAQRFPRQSGDLAQRNEGYRKAYESCVMGYRPLHIDAFLISCTGSNYRLGEQQDKEVVRQLTAKTGVPTVTSTGVIHAALEALKVRGLVLVSPYPAWLTSESAEYWKECGYRLDEVIQLGEGLDNIAFELDDDYVADFLEKLPQPKPDAAILMTGTGMPTIGAIAKTRHRFQVPVLSSNLCGVWWLLKQTGHKSGSEEFNQAAGTLLALL